MKIAALPTKPYTFRFTGEDLDLPWLHTLLICEYRSARTGRWHHHDHDELVCRLKGVLDYDFKNRPSLTLHQGHALVIPAGTVHRLADEIDAPGVRICLLLKDGEQEFHPGTIPSPSAFRQMMPLLKKRAFVPFVIPPPLLERMILITKLAGQEDLTQSPLVYSQFRLFITDVLLTLATAHPPTRTSSSQIIEQATTFLDSRLAAKVNIHELLNYIGYGQSQFFRLFKENTGLTPNEWLCRKRIAHACKLLIETNDSICEIAGRSGFPDPSYFCRVFKQQIGQTPRLYRISHTLNP